jgi:hypothetical protein
VLAEQRQSGAALEVSTAAACKVADGSLSPPDEH